jgi:hypothetical protein
MKLLRNKKSKKELYYKIITKKKEINFKSKCQLLYLDPNLLHLHCHQIFEL